MNKIKSSRLTLGLLILALLAGSYLFYQYRLAQNNLVKNTNALIDIKTQLSQYNELITIDSLLLRDQYPLALEAYQSLSESSTTDNLNNAIELRTTLTERMAQLQEAAEVLGSISLNNPDELPPDLLRLDPIPLRDPKADEKRQQQLDSLAFALDKAALRIARLQDQVKKNPSGNYLTFTSKKGNTIYYVGDVSNGKAHGNGIGILSTGSRYEGGWKNALKHGDGIFHWLDGASYEGAYVDDRRHGLGTYHWPNKEKFVGLWENDLRNGEGTFYGSDGKVVATGIWKDDELVQEK